LLLSNAPWLLGSGKLGTPCERRQRAHLSSAAMFAPPGRPDRCPPGPNARHAWLADLNAGSLWFRSLPGPASIWNATPPPGRVVGSGKSETPWLRTHRAYARSSALGDPEPPLPAPLESPQPAVITATPRTAAIAAAVRLAANNRRRPEGFRAGQPQATRWLVPRDLHTGGDPRSDPAMPESLTGDRSQPGDNSKGETVGLGYRRQQIAQGNRAQAVALEPPSRRDCCGRRARAARVQAIGPVSWPQLPFLGRFTMAG
jgi:hypothetical protein